jgi:hypothetical protein
MGRRFLVTEPTTQATFYVPSVKKEEPLRLDSNLLARTSKLPDVIKVRLKESAVAHQIATGLYESPQAGFREVYSNEQRAARTAQQKFGAKPRIEITVDTEHRLLTIQGHDSLGITAQVFADVLRWMGRTTNNDENEVGQFGWGFFAIWTLADSMRLETYARETDERYGVTAKDAGAFSLLSDAEVTIQECGTKIRLNLKKDIDLPALVGWIEKNCRYSDTETYLTITKDLVTVTNPTWGFRHVALEKGRKRLDNAIKKRLQQQVSGDCERVLYDVEFDTPDYYFYGVIGGDDQHAHLSGDEEDREVLLLGVPIEAPDATSIEWPFTSWVLNIKNERKYPPTPDRDRFLENALKPIIDELQSCIEKRLAELKIASLDDYRSAPWKGIYASVDSSHKWLDERTRELAWLLSIEVVLPGDDEEVTEKERRWQSWLRRCGKSTLYTHIRLRHLVARSQHLFYHQMPRREDGREIILAKKMSVVKAILRTQRADAEVFTYVPLDRNSWDNEERSPVTALFLRMLKGLGINLDAPAEAEKVKRKLGRNWRTICGLPQKTKAQMQSVDWPVHKRFEGGRVEPRRFKTKSIPAGVIRVPSNLKKYIAALELAESEYGVTRDHKCLRGGQPLAAFLGSVKNKTVLTKHDQATFDQIVRSRGKIVIYITEKTEVLQFYTAPEADVTVATNGDRAFELIAYLIAKERQYTIIRYPDAKNFHERTGLELKEIVGNYPSTSDSERATIAHIGASIIKTPQIRLLLLHAIKSTYSAEEAQACFDRALALDAALTSENHCTETESLNSPNKGACSPRR